MRSAPDLRSLNTFEMSRRISVFEAIGEATSAIAYTVGSRRVLMPRQRISTFARLNAVRTLQPHAVGARAI